MKNPLVRIVGVALVSGALIMSPTVASATSLDDLHNLKPWSNGGGDTSADKGSASTNDNVKKLEDIRNQARQANQHEKIRVMVLLKNQPHGAGNESTNLGQVDSVIKELENSGVNLKVRRSFGLLVKGFSAEVTRADMFKILANPQVQDVKPLKTFHTTSISTRQMLQATAAHESYGSDGSGVLVSIIDTGIDIHHHDMYIDSNAPKKMKPAEGFNEKVPWGYNFADHNNIVKDCDVCEQHGMHVAGIVAAHGSRKDAPAKDQESKEGWVDGIAPNAQLLAMKVFSNDPKYPSAYEDDLVAAIEKSVKLKADVINMSLGADNDLNNTAPIGEARAIANAKEAGVQVVVAAGNAGRSFSSRGDNNSIDPNFLDDGAIGSPAVYSGSLAVASIDDTVIPARAMDLTINGNKYETTYSEQGKYPVDKTKTYEVVYAGLGTPADIEKVKDKLKGKMALIKRGGATFTAKFKNAVDAGAVAVMVFNNVGNWMSPMGGIDDFKVPAGGMQVEDANKVIKALEKNEKVEVRLDDKTVLTPDKDNGGKPSSFTSWGTGNDLEFKPEIAGVGGNIYSTLNDNKHGMMSGTSMATPSIAGVTALMLQTMRSDKSPFKGENPQSLDAKIKTTLSNTAAIVYGKDNVPYTPRQIGAGLAQTKSALENRVYVTVNDKPNVALKAFTGSKSFTMKLHNYGEHPVTFNVDKTCVLNEDNNTVTKTVCSKIDSISFDKQTVTVPQGGDAEVTATVAVNSSKSHWVSGWVKFEDATHKNPDVHMPYMGFVGDWNAESIFVKDLKTSPFTAGLCTELGLAGEKSPCGYNDMDDPVKQELGTILLPQLVTLDEDGNQNPVSDNTVGLTAAKKIIPQVVMQRGAKNIKAEIRDSKGNTLRVIGTENDVPRPTLSNFIADKLEPTVLNGLAWDGTVWDVEKGKYEPVKTGDYVFHLSATLADGFEPQIEDIKFHIDDEKPVIKLVSNEQKGAEAEVTVNVTDDSNKVTVAGIPGDGSGIIAGVAESNGNYKLTVKNAEKAEHLLVIAKDVAGNSSVYLVMLGKAPFIVTKLSGSINGKADLDKEGYLHIVGIASEGTASVRIKETGETAQVDNSGKAGDLDQAKPKGYFEIKYKPQPGENNVTLEALDAGGNVIAQKVLTFIYDTKPAEVKVSESCLKYEPKPVGKDTLMVAAINGTAKDDYAKKLTATISEDAKGLSKINFADDGSFSGEVMFAPDKVPAIAHLVVSDGANDQIVPIPTCGATPGDNGPIYDPSTWNAKKTDIITAVTVGQDLEKKGNGEYTFHFKGKFLRKPSSFEIGGYAIEGEKTIVGGMEPVTVGDDLSFEKDLTLKDGLNKFYYEIKENGKLVEASYLRIAVDNGIPKIVLKQPNAKRDGAVYMKKQGKLPISGVITDNQFGFNLYIDGNAVADYYSPWDKDSGGRDVSFDYNVNVKENYGIHSFEVQDQNGNYYVRNFPVIIDAVKPVVDLPIEANKHYKPDTTFDVKVSDEYLDNASVILDGKPYDAKSVEYQLNKDVYEESNGDKDPGSVLKPITGSDDKGNTNGTASNGSTSNGNAGVPATTGKDTDTVTTTGKADSKDSGSKAALDRYNAAKSNSKQPAGDPVMKPVNRTLDFTVKDLTPGAHTVEVKSVDMAGNETTKQVSFFVNGVLSITGPDEITLDATKNLKEQIDAAYKAVVNPGKATLAYNIAAVADNLVLSATDDAGQKVTRTIKVLWKDNKKPSKVDNDGSTNFTPKPKSPIVVQPHAKDNTDANLSATGSDANSLMLVSLMVLAAGVVLVAGRRVSRQRI